MFNNSFCKSIGEKQAYFQVVQEKQQLEEKLEQQQQRIRELEQQIKGLKNNQIVDRRVTFRDLIQTKVTMKYKDNQLENLRNAFQGQFTQDIKESNEINPDKWDYVLVTHNPEYSQEIQNRNITWQQAENYYKRYFCVSLTFKSNQEFLKEIESFEQAFNRLESSGSDEDEKLLIAQKVQGTHSTDILDTNRTANDFLTLMRNIIVYKLVYQCGLHIQQILSSNLQYIYILIQNTNKNLKDEASKVKRQFQIEQGIIDLRSLEPCDKRLRPLSVLQIPNRKHLNILFQKYQKQWNKIVGNGYLFDQEEIRYAPKGLQYGDWASYRIYMNLMINGMDKKLLGIPQNYKLHYIQKLMQRSIQRVNLKRPRRYHLKNLYQRQKIMKPIPPYLSYDKTNQQLKKIWRTYKINELGGRSYFKNTDRLFLTLNSIQSWMALHNLQADGFIVTYFPFTNHWEMYGKSRIKNRYQQDNAQKLEPFLRSLWSDKDLKTGLVSKWDQKFFDTNIPLPKIRKYFGEKIALYFAFTALYGNGLFYPGFIGAIAFVIQQYTEETSIYMKTSNLVYSLVMIVWAAIFLNVWRQEETILAIKWGQLEFTESEIPRPQFQGIKRRSPVNDQLEEEWYSFKQRKSFYLLSLSVSGLLLLIVIGLVAAVTVLRWSLTEEMTYWGIDFAGPVCSGINAIQIQIFNLIYEFLVIKLTNWENHRTQTSYEDSLKIKTYIFQFVNSFSTLYYIAFIKTHWEGCVIDKGGSKQLERGASCLGELYVQLAALLIVFIGKNAVELGVPYYKQMKQKKKMQQESDLLFNKRNEFDVMRNEIEHQLSLPPYVQNQIDGTVEDYLELAVLFSYITLFAVAFPLSTMISYLAIMAEIRVDRYKMLNLVRRPDPIGARNIGNWWVIFNGISVIAIFTNVGLLCFTLRTFNDWPIFNYNTYLTFAVIVTFLLLFRTWLNGFIKQIPKNYRILLKRHKHLKNKVMQNNPELQRKSRIGGFVTGQELIEVDTLGNTVSSE